MRENTEPFQKASVRAPRARLAVSERRACRVVGQSRTTQRRQPKTRSDERRLTAAIIRLAKPETCFTMHTVAQVWGTKAGERAVQG